MPLIGTYWVPKEEGIPEKTVEFSVLNFGNLNLMVSRMPTTDSIQLMPPLSVSVNMTRNGN